jgi:hypothetical protein
LKNLEQKRSFAEKLNGQDPYEWAKDYIDKQNQQEKEEKRQVIVKFKQSKLITKGNRKPIMGGISFFSIVS